MSKRRWLTAEEEEAWRSLRRMWSLLALQIGRDLARDSGLSDSDYDVLSTLSERSDHRWRASDLAARLLWSTSRLAHQVGRMEARGLVLREPCPDDGRGAVISLTEQGWSVLREAAALHVASVRRHFVDLLSPGEITVLGEIADKVIADLHREDAATTKEPRPEPVSRRSGAAP